MYISALTQKIAAAVVAGLISIPSLSAAAPGQTSESPKPVADFTVATADGSRKFTLSQARGKFVALHFLLKTECPFCIAHTHSYAKHAAELPNVEQVFLKPDAEADIKTWEGKLGAKGGPGYTLPAIYRDADAKLATQLGIPDGYKFHGQTVHYPALVLIDPQGREVFRYIGKSNSDRMAWDAFAAKVAQLQGVKAQETTATLAVKSQ